MFKDQEEQPFVNSIKGHDQAAEENVLHPLRAKIIAKVKKDEETGSKVKSLRKEGGPEQYFTIEIIDQKGATKIAAVIYNVSQLTSGEQAQPDETERK